MPKHALILTLLIVCLSCLSAIAAERLLPPTDLRCEYRKNPLGIDTAKPRLSWHLEASDPSARGLKQRAYQILVASSEERLGNDQGDFWDTGRVESDKSIQVPYGGKPLASGTPVWWKVRVWDSAGTPSNWSGPAFWSMGLLNPEDWRGKWIGLDEGEGQPEELGKAHWIWSSRVGPGTRYFRRTIEIAQDNPVSDALLYLVGSGNTALYINGQPVGSTKGIENPISTDITQALHSGHNVFAVSVSASGDAPSGLIGAIQMELARGEPTVIDTDQEWRVSSTESHDWNKPEFNDTAWSQAKVLGEYGMAPWGEVGWAERTVLPARMLRKDFNVSSQVKRATLYISGLGLSEAYLNGEKIGDGVLVPALSDYDKRVYYLTYDVTSRLTQGANALGVILGNGRYFAPRHKVPTFTRTFGYPKLLLQLEIQHSDGTVERVVSDENWKLTTEGPIRANNEYDGEIYDGRREIEGWSRPGFDDSGWEKAQAVKAPAGVLSSQMIEPIRVTETLKPVAVNQVSPGVYMFDMGQNMVGWCRLTVSGPKGTQVTLRHAERLRPDATLYLDNLRSALVTDVYTLKGEGTEVYEPRFTYHGFRYVEMKGFPGKPSLASLEGREVHDAVEQHADFTSSNPLLNQIYKNVVWGTKDNYRSMPTDCPQRDERQGWLGDRSAESRGEPYMFDVAGLYAKWVDDMADSQDEKGRVSDVSPAYWPFRNENVTWPSSFIIIPDHLYDQYGDLEVIRRHYEGMKKWIAHMQTFLKGDLMPRDVYGDWCVPPESPELIHSNDPARRTEGPVLGTTYFYHLLRLMARFATLLDKPDDAKDFNALADRLVAAFNKTYFHEATGRYSNGSQTSSVLPLAFGMVAEQDRQKVAEALARKIQDQSQGHTGTGLIGGQWLMQVLSANGHPEVAYEIASQKSYPSWGYMAGQGATTIWELWNGDTANPAMNSGNHLMLVGDLITWLYENLAGIRPDPAQPGFKHIVMHPTPAGDLTFVRASHKSPYGEISSDWKRDGDRFTWSVSIPVNTTATVYIPADREASVKESAQPAAQTPGVKYLGREAGAVVYEIGSGSYHFESILPR
ncbi:MAG: glycoside hydrolase family 78 protein [Terriglobia bacterium]